MHRGKAKVGQDNDPLETLERRLVWEQPIMKKGNISHRYHLR